MSFLRRLFHTHDFELVAVTYSCPKKLSGHDVHMLEGEYSQARIDGWVHGVTTHLWKCSDPACHKTIVAVMLGLPMVEETEAMTGRSVLKKLLTKPDSKP